MKKVKVGNRIKVKLEATTTYHIISDEVGVHKDQVIKMEGFEIEGRCIGKRKNKDGSKEYMVAFSMPEIELVGTPAYKNAVTEMNRSCRIFNRRGISEIRAMTLSDIKAYTKAKKHHRLLPKAQENEAFWLGTTTEVNGCKAIYYWKNNRGACVWKLTDKKDKPTTSKKLRFLLVTFVEKKYLAKI